MLKPFGKIGFVDDITKNTFWVVPNVGKPEGSVLWREGSHEGCEGDLEKITGRKRRRYRRDHEGWKRTSCWVGGRRG